MNDNPVIRQGMRLAYIPKGHLPGRKKMNFVIAVINGLLNLKITNGTKPFLVLSEESGILQMPMSPSSGGGTVTAGPGISVDGSVVSVSDPDNLIGVHVIKMREWDVCVPDGSGGLTQKKALFLSSEAY